MRCNAMRCDTHVYRYGCVTYDTVRVTLGRAVVVVVVVVAAGTAATAGTCVTICGAAPYWLVAT